VQVGKSRNFGFIDFGAFSKTYIFFCGKKVHVKQRKQEEAYSYTDLESDTE